MLNDASGFSHIYIACGYTDLRLGIDGLAAIVQNSFKLDPFNPSTLFLFWGRRTDRLKALRLFPPFNYSDVLSKNKINPSLCIKNIGITILNQSIQFTYDIFIGLPNWIMSIY